MLSELDHELNSNGDREYKSRIIDFIRRNRVSSTEVADCLGKTGGVLGVGPVNRGHFAVGNVFWVYAYGESNWKFHEQIQYVSEGDIVFTEVFDCADRAVFGDIVSKYLLLYRQVSALVVTGRLRDAPRLIKENWPIWCEGFSPIGCSNAQLEHDLALDICAEHRARYDGTVAVCDDTGVVVIPKECLNQSFMRKLEFIETQEDIWYDCIDRKKWSTFETICLKRYEDDE